MEPLILASALSIGVAFAALTIAAIQFVTSRHNDRVREVTGEKEAVAFGAVSLIRRDGPLTGVLPGSRRRQLVRAMCVAAVFERSDRAQALLHEALRERSDLLPEYRVAVCTIQQAFDSYPATGKLKDGQSNLEALKSLDPDDYFSGENGCARLNS